MQVAEVKDFDNASILFADVKGFSALAKSKPDFK
ncbi:MAG: hypothetical protein EAZ51_09765, partial [Sphingobacteriales bacterium]